MDCRDAIRRNFVYRMNISYINEAYNINFLWYDVLFSGAIDFNFSSVYFGQNRKFSSQGSISALSKMNRRIYSENKGGL